MHGKTALATCSAPGHWVGDLMDPKSNYAKLKLKWPRTRQKRNDCRSGSLSTKPPSGGSSGGSEAASKGRFYWLGSDALIAAALAISRAMDDRDVERLRMGFHWRIWFADRLRVSRRQ